MEHGFIQDGRLTLKIGQLLLLRLVLKMRVFTLATFSFGVNRNCLSLDNVEFTGVIDRVGYEELILLKAGKHLLPHF